ncbi:MAG: mechanosensitive ion channel [Burkholderiales bacterium]|jgi:small-conductance mechanosensitive channel|nr:mechanosensitive ion channel [Burkholderiales bacterium]
MLETLNISLVEKALTTAIGWLDLLITLACLGTAMALSRYWRYRKNSLIQDRVETSSPITQALTRIVFPVLAFCFILLVSSLFRLYAEPLFLDVALPLVIALLVIRLMVYTLRTLFSQSSWLKVSERAIVFSVWFLVVLYFLGILPELIRELNALILPLGSEGISLWTLIKGLIVVGFAVSVTLWFSDLLEQKILPRNVAQDASYSGKLFFVRFLRAILLVIAVLLALQGIGIDLTVFAVLGGAIGVGIGLGLQRIAANYIAGFAILAERSIKIGDMVTVGSQFGIVKEVSARYIVLRSLEGIDALIPNEIFLTQVVLNHSSNQRAARSTLAVQVGYNTDLRLAIQLMQQAAIEQSRVLDGEKSPVATVAGFGDSGIDLTLGFWIRDPENGQSVLKSNINLRIWDLFVEHGIEIPYPQREVRVLGLNENTPPLTDTAKDK